LAGQDLLVRAKTGTGKTAAFGIPLVERCEPGLRKVQVLVLSPTRELANQIATEIAGIAKYRDLRILPIYGGVGMGGQEKALREGVEIVIGTPGRVLDHLRRGNLNLSNVRGVCLDEADEMLSMGFYEDVSSILDHDPRLSRQMPLVLGHRR
jgi:ATP-dependent RNA helicase DeaD